MIIRSKPRHLLSIVAYKILYLRKDPAFVLFCFSLSVIRFQAGLLKGLSIVSVRLSIRSVRARIALKSLDKGALIKGGLIPCVFIIDAESTRSIPRSLKGLWR